MHVPRQEVLSALNASRGWPGDFCRIVAARQSMLRKFFFIVYFAGKVKPQSFQFFFIYLIIFILSCWVELPDCYLTRFFIEYFGNNNEFLSLPDLGP